MNRIPTRRRRLRDFVDLSSWTLGVLTGFLFFAIQSFVRDPDTDAVPAQQLEDARQYHEHDMELLKQIGGIAREAHAQGMREALASTKGTTDYDGLQRSCARLWGMEHGQ